MSVPGAAALVVVALAGPALAMPALVPRPERLRTLPGVFVLSPNTVILADRASVAEAAGLAAALAPATGFDLEVSTRRVRRRCPARRRRARCRPWIRLVTATRRRRLGAEGYRLVVRPGGVRIVAAGAAGLFRAGTTLRQLLPAAIFGRAQAHGVAWEMPAVRILDRPRLPWRGVHLDVARSFMPAQAVKRLLDALALHKVNRFHWHLTDDQGWRLPIAAFPALTEVGGWRSETPRRLLPSAGLINLFLASEGDGMPTGGAYTAAEIADVIRHATARHIAIVPEIDMPGHMQAALAAVPALRPLPGAIDVATTFGPQPYVVGVGDQALAVLDAIVAEVATIFPGDTIHLGGDEVVLAQWEASPDARARMTALGLPDVRALFGWFVARMAGVVRAQGRRAMVWHDARGEGLDPTVAVMAWLGVDAGIAAAEAGHDVVMTPLDQTYFDHAPARPLPPDEQAVLDARVGADSGLQRAFTTDLAEAWAFDPVPAGLSEAARPRVLGAQGMLWTEYLRSPAEVERFAFPRVAALAERVWSPPAGADFDDFLARLRTHVRRLDALGVASWPLPE